MSERDTPSWAGAIAGATGAAAALATTEIVTSPGNRGPSLITAVGSRFIDRFAASLKDLAVRLFGTNDKAALVVGIVVTSVILGVVLGIVSRRRSRRWVGVAGFAAFGALGLWAGVIDPLASTPRMVAGALCGAVVGIAVLVGLMYLARQSEQAAAIVAEPSPAPVPTPRAQDPRVKIATRRQFLGVAGGALAVSAVGATVARGLRTSVAAARNKAALLLPAAKSVVSAPATQPFSVEGLTPYITGNADFYRIDTAIGTPQVDVEHWTLKVTGMVDHPLTLTFNDLLGFDLVEEPITMQCVSNEVGDNLIGNAVFRGVPLKAILDRAGVHQGATQIVGRSVDDFTAGFPTEKAFDGRTAMIAVAMNGEPLPIAHGFPARLVVAGLYGYVSATKWLSEIELTTLEGFDGFWIPRGWAKEGPIKTEARIDVPRANTKLAPGTVAIAGVAWAPTRGVAKVEVRLDDGPWIEATLGDAASKNTWVQWMTPWAATSGSHLITVRATDGNGEVQTDKIAPPDPDGATGYPQRRVTVA